MEYDSTLNDKVFSFLLGVIIVFLFWITFKPRYIIVKNGQK